MDPEDLTMSEVAATLNVSTQTIRRLLNRDGLKAPSKEYRRGKFWVYIYTPEDVRELQEHLNQRISQRITHRN